jgi:alkanesulfonate monooxygenase SsuD/methylene tetrahydromethanopterin reductase-like flavin-dependent oxidoreductase (luciferase family)
LADLGLQQGLRQDRPLPELGLFLNVQHPPERPAQDVVREILEHVRVARECGFASIWAGQHFLSHPYQMLQTVPLLARVAAETGDMTIGTGIALLPLLNPVEAAEHAATLDAISGGRFVYGVGAGYRAEEDRAFGLPKGRRAGAFEAKLAVVQRLLAGERVSASGDGYELHDASLALVPPVPPPIWIAANSDAAVERAARLSDAWFVNPHTRLDELERQIALFDAARAAAGRPERTVTPILKEVCVADSDEEALACASPYLKAKYEAYVAWGQSDVLPGGDTLRREFDALTAGGRFIIGSPESCAAQLREHIERLGADHIVVRVQWPGMPSEFAVRSIRLLAREVLPALASAPDPTI